MYYSNRVLNRFAIGIFSAAVTVALCITFSVPAGALTGVSTVTFIEQVSGVNNNYSQATNVPSPLKSISTFIPPVSNPGYTFLNWNTAPNGSGTSYADGAVYPFTSDAALYAQWRAIAILHTVTFFENATVNDLLSSFVTSTNSAPLTKFANVAPAFSNPGNTFLDWNTAPNGSGTSYADGATYSFTSDTALYAQWALIQVVFTQFVANGGIGSIASVSDFLGSSTTLPSISGVSNPGHTFVDWNTAADGSGTSYSSGSNYVFSGNQSLYAQWSADIYQVTYVSNGGSVILPPLNFTYGTTALVLPTLVNAGFHFNGWFTAAAGGTLVGLGGAAFSPSDSVDLYAQWTQVVIDTLTFDANGGSGYIPPISGPDGSSITLPGQLGMIDAGRALARWTAESNGSGLSFSTGQIITLSSSSTLYAQWTGHASAVLFGAIGDFAKNSSALSPSLKNQIKRLALTVKVKKYHSVRLFGYTAVTGLQSLNLSLSRARATRVANYLRWELRILQIKSVSVASAGEGAIAGRSGAAYSRVEVFVL